MYGTIMYGDKLLICRLHQRTMMANGKPESEPDSAGVTNGVCDGSEASRTTMPTGSIAQPMTVPSSQKLQLSAHEFDLTSDAASQDGLAMVSDGSDVVNGNYVSSSEDQVPSPSTSVFSEESVQMSITVDVAVSSDKTPTKQHMASADDDIQSSVGSAVGVMSDRAAASDDAKHAVIAAKESEAFRSDRAVCDEKDLTSVVASDKTALNKKQAEVLPMPASMISDDRTEIPAMQFGAFEHASTDASLFPTDKTFKTAFPAQKTEMVRASDKIKGHIEPDSKDSVEKLPSAVSTNKAVRHLEDTEGTTAEDFTRKLAGTVGVEDSEEGLELSHVASEVPVTVPADERVTRDDTVGTESVRSQEMPCDVVSDVGHTVLKTHVVTDGHSAVVGLGTHPADMSQGLEDVSLYSSRQDTSVGTPRKIGEYEGDGTVTRQELTTVMPSSEPRKPLPSDDAGASISGTVSDQDKSRRVDIMAEAASNDSVVDLDKVLDSGDSDLNRTDGKRDLSVRLPKKDHYDNGVEVEDEEYDDDHRGDVDKVDSAADDTDEDTTSSQVAPRSVKMHETAKGKQSGSKTATVVCARPSRASGSRASTMPSAGGLPETVDTTEVPHDDESDKSKEGVKHHSVVDDEELSVAHDVEKKIPSPELADEVDQTPGVDLTGGDQSDVVVDQRHPVSHRRPSEDVSQNEPEVRSPSSPVKSVPSHGADDEIDVRRDPVNKGTEDTQSDVEDSQTITAHPEKEKAFDLQPSHTEVVQSDRTASPSLSQELDDANTLPGNVGGHAPDLQASLAAKPRDGSPSVSQRNLTDENESGRTDRQQLDIRRTDAELAVLRPWEIQQCTAADDGQKYGTDEHHRGTSAAGDDRRLTSDKADDSGGFSVSKAVKTGLMAVVAAPYVAGMVISDALKSDARTTTDVPRSDVHDDRQTAAEMTRTSTEDQRRRPLDDGDNVSQSSGSCAAEDRLHFSKSDLPGQLDQGTVQQPDSMDGRRGEASDTAAKLTASVNADNVTVRQPSDVSNDNFQQPMSAPLSATSGSEQPASPESYDDRSNVVQSSVNTKPLLPVVASTRPLEVTMTTSPVPAAISTQPSLSTLDSTPFTAASTQLYTQTTHSTVSTVESTLSMESILSTSSSIHPVTQTTMATAPTVDSALPSAQSTAASPSTTSAQLSELSPSGLDSSEVPAETTRAPSSTAASVTSSAWTTDTTVLAVRSDQPSTVTAQSDAQTVPSSQPFSETLKSTVQSEGPAPVVTSTTTISTVLLAQPSTVTAQSDTQTVPSLQTFAETPKSTVQSKGPTPVVTSATTISTVPLAQPSTVTAQSDALSVPLSEPFAETPKSTVQSEGPTPVVISTTTISTVPLAQPSTVTSQYTASTVPSTQLPTEIMLPTSTSIELPASATEAVATVAITQLSSDPSQATLSTTATSIPCTCTADTKSSTEELSEPNVGSTEPSVEATVPTPALTSSSALPTLTTVPTVMLSQPLMVPDVQAAEPSTETMKPAVSTTPLTRHSSETLQSTVPSTQLFTEDTQSILPATAPTEASTETYASVGSGSPSLQTSSDAVSSTTTTPSSSTVVMSEQRSEPSLPVTAEVTSQAAVPSAVSSDQYQVTPHVKSSVEQSAPTQVSLIPPHEETDDRFTDNETTSLQDPQADRSSVQYSAAASPGLLSPQKKAEVDDETAHVQREQYKQRAITDDDWSSMMLSERDEVPSELSDERAQNISGGFLSENQARDSGQSSVAGSVKTAVKAGLLGIVGAPVLAGMAVADALKSKSQGRQGSQTTGPVQGNVIVSQHELEPATDDDRKQKARPRETDVEPDVTKLQKPVTFSDQPSTSAVTVSTDAHIDHKYVDTQAASQAEFQLQVSVDSRDIGGDQLNQLDGVKEVRDKPEIADTEHIIQNDVGRGMPSSVSGLSLPEALLSSLYDQQKNCFIDPTTGHHISLASAIQLGLIDGTGRVIADLSSGEVISVLEALSRGIINPETGMVSVDGEARVALNEALASGLIMDDADGDLLELAASIGTADGRAWNEATDVTHSVGELQHTAVKSRHRQSPLQPSRPLKLVQMLDLGLYDPVSGAFRDPQSSDSLSLADTIRCHLLDKNSVVINDPQSEEVLSLEESIRGGLVSGSTSLVHDTSTAENISLTEALHRGILIPRPMSIATAINIGLYDEANGMFFDPTNGLYFALEEAVEGGLIDPHSLVIDPATGKVMAVAAALACGVLDARHGNVVNIHTGEVIPLKQMAVSSQATFGSQPVGVSNQVTAASADVENGVKPTAGPDVHDISVSRTVSTLGPSGAAAMTRDGGMRIKDTREDVSTEHDTSEIMKLIDEASDTGTDALQGDEMFTDSLHQPVNHVPSSADITADARPSVDELTNDVTALVGEDAGKTRQTESAKVQPVLSDEQALNKIAEAATTYPMGESSEVPDESYRAPVCDESPAEIKRHDDTRPVCDDSLPADVSSSLIDETARLSFVGDDSVPALATTALLNISHQFHPTLTVRPEDDGASTPAVPGVSSMVTVQHILSSSVAAAVPDSPVKAGDVDSARDGELQWIAVAGPLHYVGDISAGITQAEAATCQLPVPDSMHGTVGLDELTQVEFTVAQDHGISQMPSSTGSRDIQALHEMKQIEVKPISGEVLKTDDAKKIDSSRDNVSEDDRKEDDRYDLKKDTENVVEYRDVPTGIVQTAVKTLPSGDDKKEDSKRDDAFKSDAEKDTLKKDGTPKDRPDVHVADIQQVSSILSVEGDKKDTVKKDEAKRYDVSDNDLKKNDLQKDVAKKVEAQKDAQNVVEFQHVERLSNIEQTVVEHLPDDEVRKDEEREDDSKLGDLMPEVKDVTRKDEVPKLSTGIVEKPLSAGDVIVKSRDDVQRLSDVIQVEVKHFPEDVGKEDVIKKDMLKGDGVSEDGEKTKKNGVWSHDEVAGTEGYIDDAAAGLMDVDQKLSDMADHVRQREIHADIDVADKRQIDKEEELVGVNMHSQKQQKLVFGGDVFAEERVSTTRRHEDELAAENDDIQRWKKDITADHNVPLTTTALVSVF